MLEFEAVEFDAVIIHRVGNRNEESPCFFSEETIPVDEEMHRALSTYFFKPFVNASETYQFTHTVDVSYNPVKGLAEEVFNNTEVFIPASRKLVEHLYEQSGHPHIKTGDVFVVCFHDLLIDERLRKGIGIFKSENKDSFLKLVENDQNLALNMLDGININKLDKGVLILDTDDEIRFKVLSVDQNSYDAEYWKTDFLGIDYVEDNHFVTKNYIDLCKGFAEEVIKPNANKKAEVDFLNASVKYFNRHEQVTSIEFQQEVFKNPVQIEAFEEYKSHFEERREITFEDAFDISKPILQKEKRKIKNYIRLDTNIQIKLDFNNPESSEHFIEQGYDEERGMSFYKIYFNKELK
jgi:hypothetical protein